MNLFDIVEFWRQVKWELARMQNIPSLGIYSQAWYSLAKQFDSCGMEFNAQECRTRGEHYDKMAGGEYVRLFEGQVAELIIVEAE